MGLRRRLRHRRLDQLLAVDVRAAEPGPVAGGGRSAPGSASRSISVSSRPRAMRNRPGTASRLAASNARAHSTALHAPATTPATTGSRSPTSPRPARRRRTRSSRRTRAVPRRPRRRPAAARPRRAACRSARPRPATSPDAAPVASAPTSTGVAPLVSTATSWSTESSAARFGERALELGGRRDHGLVLESGERRGGDRTDEIELATRGLEQPAGHREGVGGRRC